MAKALDLLLEKYFAMPSRSGFSAYRTGWFVHFVFSALLAAGITAAAMAMGSTLVTGLAAALAGVVLAWGVGVLVGVISHYNPLISLAVLGIGVALLVFDATMPYAVFGMLIAASVHVVVMPTLIFALEMLRKVVP